MHRQAITNRLQSLKEIEDVCVTVSKKAGGTIRTKHRKRHGLEFLFVWTKDHFLGYFIDSKASQSQAVISLETPMAAIQFVAAYMILNEVRANQKA